MPTNVSAAIVELSRAFSAAAVRWYVFGAQAVIAAGVPRLTADIDVTAELPAGGAHVLVDRLAEHGFALRDLGDVATFIAQTRVIPVVHRASGIPVDVVLAGPGLEEDMLGLEDVRALVRAAPAGLSLEDARARVAELGALLDDTLLLASFDAIAKPTPSPKRKRAPKK